MIQFGRKPSLLRFLAAFALTVMVAPLFAAGTDESMATVPLRMREVDARDPATFAPDGTERTRLWIIQFAEAPTHDDRTLIAQSGAELVDYLPFDAYMIFDQTGEAVAKLRDAMAAPDSSVRLLAPFRDTDAIDPQLLGDEVWTAVSERGSNAFGEVPVVIVLADVPGFGGADATQIEREILKDRETLSAPMRCRYQVIGTTLKSREEMEEISFLETVVNIELAPPMEFFGESAAQIIANRTSGSPEVPLSPLTQGYGDWLRAKLGAGVPEQSPQNFPLCFVVDNGIDNGKVTDAGGTQMPDSPDFLSASGKSRVVTGFFTNSAGAVSYADSDREATSNGNHGHRAASVLGGFNETVSQNPATEDVMGFNHGQGVNPLVRLGNAKLANLPIVTPPLTTPVYRRHAREMGSQARLINWNESMYNSIFGVHLAHKSVFSTNSWGVNQSPPITYSEWSRMADYIVRDCVPADNTPGLRNWPEHQGMFSVFAAGNSGWDTASSYIFDSVANPGLAKNVLTVGGSQDVYYAPNPEPPQCSPTPTPVMLCTCNPAASCDSLDRQGIDASRMYANSSKGNNAAYLTKRSKPDLVAPAQSVRANLWQYATDINQCAFPQTCFVGKYYEAENGTSWAAPGVTGAASVLARFISKTYSVREPSPALMKAYMIHTARFLRGQGTGSTPSSTPPMRIPSPVQGYGRVNLDFGFDASVPRYIIDQSVVFDDAGASGDSFQISGKRKDPTKPFRAVLAWTDHPANTCSGGAGAGAIFNDLDLAPLNSHFCSSPLCSCFL